MDAFRGLNTTRPGLDTDRISAGAHLLSPQKCKLIKSQRNPRDMYFVAEFVVSDSTDKDTRPGERRSWSSNLTYGESSLRDVRCFIAAALGVDFDAVNEDVCNQIVSGDGTAIQELGKSVRCDARMKTTKAGHDFLVCRWHTAAGESKLAA